MRKLALITETRFWSQVMLNPINIRWIRTGSQPYYPHDIRGKLSIILMIEKAGLDYRNKILVPGNQTYQVLWSAPRQHIRYSDVCRIHPYIYPSFYKIINLSIHLSNNQPILLFIYSSIHLYISIYPFVYLSINLSIHSLIY